MQFVVCRICFAFKLTHCWQLLEHFFNHWLTPSRFKLPNDHFTWSLIGTNLGWGHLFSCAIFGGANGKKCTYNYYFWGQRTNFIYKSAHDYCMLGSPPSARTFELAIIIFNECVKSVFYPFAKGTWLFSVTRPFNSQALNLGAEKARNAKRGSFKHGFFATCSQKRWRKTAEQSCLFVLLEGQNGWRIFFRLMFDRGKQEVAINRIWFCVISSFVEIPTLSQTSFFEERELIFGHSTVRFQILLFIKYIQQCRLQNV